MAIDYNCAILKLVNRTDSRSIHIALFSAIIYLASTQSAQTMIVKISRREIMRLSKIRSNTTYHKVIRDLQVMGIIKYSSSFDPREATTIELVPTLVKLRCD